MPSWRCSPAHRAFGGRPTEPLAIAGFARRLVVAAPHGPAVGPLGDDRPAITVSGPRARMRRSGGGACGAADPAPQSNANAGTASGARRFQPDRVRDNVPRRSPVIVRCTHGLVAQWESVRLTRGRSLVRYQPGPPDKRCSEPMNDLLDTSTPRHLDTSTPRHLGRRPRGQLEPHVRTIETAGHQTHPATTRTSTHFAAVAKQAVDSVVGVHDYEALGS
jgi:hypothetical protein